ncbi:hypothetical protein QBC37DRAFT_377034 [Rhypophila decipiens]|uniref:Uncharacterized protein n=1 Tax=Rhypophila decipiens TaxID=261697 RepID=A0AAN7B4C9_9PEZI|nr:hypothetical protein QBC37DRAFT_377034 [Rhypophila decipiens]
MPHIVIYQDPRAVERNNFDIETRRMLAFVDRMDELAEEEPIKETFYDPANLPARPYGPLTEREMAIQLHAKGQGFQEAHELTHDEWKDYHEDWYEISTTVVRETDAREGRRHRAEIRRMKREIRELSALRDVQNAKFAVACASTTQLASKYFDDRKTGESTGQSLKFEPTTVARLGVIVKEIEEWTNVILLQNRVRDCPLAAVGTSKFVNKVLDEARRLMRTTTTIDETDDTQISRARDPTTGGFIVPSGVKQLSECAEDDPEDDPNAPSGVATKQWIH